MATETSTAPPTRAPIERTEHPHVVKSADTLGGEPRVEDSRIPVRQLFDLFQAGWTIAELVEDFPPLTPAQIHDAISYAHDHHDEMPSTRSGTDCATSCATMTISTSTAS